MAEDRPIDDTEKSTVVVKSFKGLFEKKMNLLVGITKSLKRQMIIQTKALDMISENGAVSLAQNQESDEAASRRQKVTEVSRPTGEQNIDDDEGISASDVAKGTFFADMLTNLRQSITGGVGAVVSAIPFKKIIVGSILTLLAGPFLAAAMGGLIEGALGINIREKFSDISGAIDDFTAGSKNFRQLVDKVSGNLGFDAPSVAEKTGEIVDKTAAGVATFKAIKGSIGAAFTGAGMKGVSAALGKSLGLFSGADIGTDIGSAAAKLLGLGGTMSAAVTGISGVLGGVLGATVLKVPALLAGAGKAAVSSGAIGAEIGTDKDYEEFQLALARARYIAEQGGSKQAAEYMRRFQERTDSQIVAPKFMEEKFWANKKNLNNKIPNPIGPGDPNIIEYSEPPKSSPPAPLPVEGFLTIQKMSYQIQPKQSSTDISEALMKSSSNMTNTSIIDSFNSVVAPQDNSKVTSISGNGGGGGGTSGARLADFSSASLFGSVSSTMA